MSRKEAGHFDRAQGHCVTKPVTENSMQRENLQSTLADAPTSYHLFRCHIVSKKRRPTSICKQSTKQNDNNNGHFYSVVFHRDHQHHYTTASAASAPSSYHVCCLPQVSFLSRQKTIFVPRQNYACSDKTKNTCLSRQK